MSNWTNIKAVTPASAAILEFETVQAHLNAPDDDEDLIAVYTAAAVASIEGPNGIGIPLLNTVYRMSLESLWEGFTIPLCPVRSIESITYTDTNGDVQTLDPALYVYDLDASPVTVRVAYGKSWPSAICQPGSVKVTFTAGYGTTGADIPADLRAAMLLTIGNLYVNRESVSAVQTYRVPETVEAILSRYRVVSFG